MSGLSEEQADKRAAIQKNAVIFGAVVGCIAGLLAFWLMAGQGGAVRFGGAIVIAAIAGYLVFKASFKSGAKAALCEKCGAAFSRSRSDHVETLKSSEPKVERETQDDKSVKVTSWTEEKLDVVDTYECAMCADVTTKAYETTRKRDEAEVIEPFVAAKSAAGKSGKGDAKGSGSARKGSSRGG